MYTGIQFANNASTQLAQACTASDTTLTVGENATAIFPKINSVGDYFMLTLADTSGHYEIVKCTAKTDTTFTVIRAQEGTTARPYPVGALLENRLTAAGIVHIAEDASTTKAHVSETGEYGMASALVYSHAKISDDFESGHQALSGIMLSPYGFQQAITRLQGLKQELLLTTSTTWTVPETGTYKVTCVGAGGKGGNGGNGAIHVWTVYEPGYDSSSGMLHHWQGAYGGGSGGGGGAGQVLTKQVALTKGQTISVTVGAAPSGTTTFGSYVTALGGNSGSNGGHAGIGSDTSGGYAGGLGYAGVSYGSATTNGVSGSASTYDGSVQGWGWPVSVGGTVGGNAGISLDGTYGNGGKGGNGGGASYPHGGAYVGTAGAAGTQGCVKIQNVIGS